MPEKSEKGLGNSKGHVERLTPKQVAELTPEQQELYYKARQAEIDDSSEGDERPIIERSPLTDFLKERGAIRNPKPTDEYDRD